MGLDREDFIAKLLEHLDKEGCEHTAQILREEFSLHGKNTQEPLKIKTLPILGIQALECLKQENQLPYADNLFTFFKNKQKVKELKKFRKQLSQISSSMRSPNIQEFYDLSHQEDEEKADLTVSRLESLRRKIDQESLLLNLVFERFGLRRGRPSLDPFYAFVYHAAQLYERLSPEGKFFTSSYYIAERKDSDGNNVVLETGGMRFVKVVVDWLMICPSSWCQFQS